MASYPELFSGVVCLVHFCWQSVNTDYNNHAYWYAIYDKDCDFASSVFLPGFTYCACYVVFGDFLLQHIPIPQEEQHTRLCCAITSKKKTDAIASILFFKIVLSAVSIAILKFTKLQIHLHAKLTNSLLHKVTANIIASMSAFQL